MVAERNRNKLMTIGNCYSISLLLVVLLQLITASQSLSIQQHGGSQNEVNGLTDAATAHTFSSPRVEYNNNEWRPVGRGDPLKNDPTYDYSPPALERVRYWAETEKDANGTDTNNTTNSTPAAPQPQPENLRDLLLKKTNSVAKNEILLLGVANNERVRGHYHPPGIPQHHPHQQHAANAPALHKNAKGEVPLLQPKYTSIRRSYYAHQHQLPTHLMPPPMQTLNPGQQQQQQSHMVKPAHGEFRHNMPGNSYMSTMGMPTADRHSHYTTHHYSAAPGAASSAASPWMHSTTMSAGGSYMTPQQQQMQQHYHAQTHHMPSPQHYDSHHQASSNYVSYSRPGMNSFEAPQSALHGNAPNAIHPPYTQNAKQTAPPRKPWVHELLQKELIKTPKPTMPATKFLMQGSTKTYFEPMIPSMMNSGGGISTTFTPMVYYPTPPTTMTTSTSTTTQAPMRPMFMYSTSPVFITVPPPTLSTTTTTTTMKPSTMGYPSLPSKSSASPQTTTTQQLQQQIDNNRLLIPNTSNLPNRPTVAPMVDMTTDSLFSHYKQPKKPLVGPMYLIIEGHSKVKTYGQNELDPHQPKIVPIIPNREPVVRRADPSSVKRGTPETFIVKHLHAKPTLVTKTTPSTITTITTTTTTPKPKPQAKTTTTTTTVRPTATIATTTKPTKPSAKPPKTVPKVTTTTTTARPTTKATTSAPTTQVPSTTAAVPTNAQQPPGGAMQGLFSFLDASLDSLFKEDPMLPMDDKSRTPEPTIYVTTTQSTKLRPVTTMKDAAAQPRIEARLRLKNISSTLEDKEDLDGAATSYPTTENALRGTRQVFDYDNLPELRLKQGLGEAEDPVSFEDAADDDEQGNTEATEEELMLESNEAEDNKAELEEAENDEADEEENNAEEANEAEAEEDDDEEDENDPTTILKRIDKLVSDSDENQFEELDSDEALNLLRDRLDTNVEEDDAGDDDDDGDDDDVLNLGGIVDDDYDDDEFELRRSSKKLANSQT